MICRGGAGTIIYDGQARTLQLLFTKAARAGKAALTAAGECTWLDRAISAAEPTCLKQTFVDATTYTPLNNAGGLVVPKASSPEAGWVRTLRTDQGYVTFHVSNPGGGACFDVSFITAG